jgi:hypothetical protein
MRSQAEPLDDKRHQTESDELKVTLDLTLALFAQPYRLDDNNPSSSHNRVNASFQMTMKERC